jgi:tRNA-(ms[2]io[6]A)-hydroxylase
VELLDRLMVSALIELRSCERFGVLSVAAADPELASLYRGLYASEMGHYLVFLELARGLPGAGDVDAAWSDWLDLEARVIRAQPPGSRVHSGPETP